MPVERRHIEASYALVFQGCATCYSQVCIHVCTGRGAFYSNSKCLCTVTNSVYGPSMQLVVTSMGVVTIEAGRVPLFDISNLA